MRYTNEQRLAYAKSISDAFPLNEINETTSIHKTAVIGMDGFGWVREKDGTLCRFPHRGNVVIQKFVVIRDFVTVDRAVEGSTVIGEGTCIDHHSHVAHGAQIGKYNTLANGCIIEGSCIVGDYNTFGAGVIVQTKVKVGNNCIFGSGAVVTKDVEDNSVMVGNPARLLRKI
jgi:UDP-3-O-[3-hydroxymyristoyl] glucosamine N-acyltransferase